MCMDIRENLVFGINFNSDIKVHKILEAHLPLAMFSVTDKHIYHSGSGEEWRLFNLISWTSSKNLPDEAKKNCCEVMNHTF